jgi:hypothetical protein
MSWTTEESGFDFRQGKKFFFSSQCPQTGCGAHPASCPIGIGASFFWEKAVEA